MEDKLREASALGDLDAMKIMLEGGAKVNDQHKMNHWTALHWAAKRNNVQAVKMLMQWGADQNLPNTLGLLPGDVASDPDVRQLLSTSKESQTETPSSTAFTPNYIQHPMVHKLDYFADSVPKETVCLASADLYLTENDTKTLKCCKRLRDFN